MPPSPTPNRPLSARPVRTESSRTIGRSRSWNRPGSKALLAGFNVDALFKQFLVLLAAHRAIDQIKELDLRDADLPGHFLQQAITKVLRAAVARLGADGRLLSIRRPIDEPMMVAVVLLKPFLLQSGFHIPLRSNRQPEPLPWRREAGASIPAPWGTGSRLGPARNASRRPQDLPPLRRAGHRRCQQMHPIPDEVPRC